jgi:hypothetical protein
MSARDFLWFLSGVLVTAAFSTFFVMNGTGAGASAQDLQNAPLVSNSAGHNIPANNATFDASDLRTASLIAQGDSADAGAQAGGATNAGSMEEVTGKLAARLAAQAGSEADWRLLAQSYDFMGRSQEAAAARSHIASATK